MHRLVCAYVVCKPSKTGLVATRPIWYYFKIITYDITIYLMTHPNFIHVSKGEKFDWSTKSKLTLKAPRNISDNFVCWSCLLQIIALHYRWIKYISDQRGPRTDCSYIEQSDLSPHCLPYRLLKHFSRREKQTTFVVIGELRVPMLFHIWTTNTDIPVVLELLPCTHKSPL